MATVWGRVSTVDSDLGSQDSPKAKAEIEVEVSRFSVDQVQVSLRCALVSQCAKLMFQYMCLEFIPSHADPRRCQGYPGTPPAEAGGSWLSFLGASMEGPCRMAVANSHHTFLGLLATDCPVLAGRISFPITGNEVV